MATNNSSNQQFTNSSDGFVLGGGTTVRSLTVTGANITLTGSGTNVYTFPASTSTLASLGLNETFSGNKTFSGTVELPATISFTSQGSIVKSGNHALTLTTGGTTNATFPSGTITLADTSTAQTFTNKTLTTPIISSISNTGTLTLPTSTDTIVGRATTDTLTNKRITKRTGTTTSSATPTINTDNVDEYYITAQTQAITSFTTNLSGTPTLGQTLFIAVTGTAARAITWGASFANGPVALPTTTVTTKKLSVLFKWSGSVWECYASGSTV